MVFKGEITVFLSLIFILLLSFVGAMIEFTSIAITKSMKQADMVMAMESVFAEYNPELLKQYGIFAKEGKALYEISSRLRYYGAGNMDHEIVRLELLSDKNGQEFYRQAVTCMGGTVLEKQPSITNPYERKAQSIKKQFEELALEISEFGTIVPALLLAQVLPQEKSLSNRTIDLSEFPSNRELQSGTGDSLETEQTLLGKSLFATYLIHHFSNYTGESNQNSLTYEIEYLLAGGSSDQENLEWVARRLLSVRVAVNYGFLLNDQEKLVKAESIAVGMSTVLAMPEAKEVIKQAFLFFWAYEDSIADLEQLFDGEKIPLGQKEGGKTAGYEEYLLAFLLAVDTEILSMRALDLMEMNLGISVDNCVTGLELKSSGYTRRNIRYTCSTYFAYK